VTLRTRRLLTPAGREHHHPRVPRTLILIPGLLCDERVWKSQAAALSGLAEVRIGVNGELDSLGALADSVIATAPERFAIAGHSMGGRIALEVARRVPQRLTGIALLDTGCEPLAAGEAGAREKARRFELLALARRDGMRRMAWTWVQGMVHPGRLAGYQFTPGQPSGTHSSDDDVITTVLDMFESRTPDLFELQIRALLNRPDAHCVLADIRCPALLLTGSEDAWSPPARHAEMAAMIPGSTVSIIAGSGHMTTIERPQAVTDALRGWLETTSV